MCDGNYLNPGLVCKPKSTIREELNKYEMRVYLPQNFVDFNDYNQPIKASLDFSQSQFDLRLQKQTSNQMQVKVSTVDFLGSEFNIWEQNLNYISNYHSMTSTIKEQDDNHVFDLSFLLDSKGTYYKRTAYTAFDFCAEMGGFIYFLVVMTQMFMYSYMKAEMNLRAVASAFRVVN